jgi:hypothetical protein
MKGVIFNLAEQVVTDSYGADTWDQLLEDADLDGAFTSLGNYPDEQFFALVNAAAGRLGVEPNAVVRIVGQGALPLLALRYPAFFAPHSSTRPFLLTLNDIIHPEVRKLYPGADVPEFGFEQDGDDVLLLDYRSHRKLCALAEGFIAGAATHYRQAVVVEQSRCMLEGAESGLLRCTFSPADSSSDPGL